MCLYRKFLAFTARSVIFIVFFSQSPFSASNVGNTLRDSFCKWQYNDPTLQSYEHDIAVLLTRNKICEQSGRRCNILGKQCII